MHPFDAAIGLQPTGDSVYAGATSADYANMVGPFGGITAAVLLNAVLVHRERVGEPVALTVNFASPVADGAFDVVARPARTNRSTQHWMVQLSQGGEVAATATAICARRRETWSAAEAQPPGDVPPAGALERAPTEGRPPWVRRYDMRFTDGAAGMAFDGDEQPHSKSRLWLRDDPPRPLDFAALAAICDAFFPRIYVRRRARVAIGTVTLTIFFHADAAMLAAQGDRPVLGCARALAYHNGYFDQSAEVWSDAGRLLASTHQMVYYRE